MVKRWIAVIVCVFALAAMAGYAINYYNELARAETISRDIADIKNQIAAREARNDEIRVEVLANVGGIDERRLNNDADFIEDVLNVAFTWSSYAEYNEMRSTLINEYGFKEDGQFLTDVFAYIPVSEYDPDYNYIDQNGLMVEFSSCKLYCIGVKGSQYNYFGEVYWRVLGQNGGSSNMVYGFTLTTNMDGTIDDLFVMDISD